MDLGGAMVKKYPFVKPNEEPANNSNSNYHVQRNEALKVTFFPISANCFWAFYFHFEKCPFLPLALSTFIEDLR